jgi:hypothetical protein
VRPDNGADAATAIYLFDVCLMRCLFDRVRELFVLRSQAGWGQKSLGFVGAMPLTIFCVKFSQPRKFMAL